MPNHTNDSVQSVDAGSQTFVATEEQQLLWQLRTKAPKSWARLTTLPMMFAIF